MEIAVLALGCFWGPEIKFSRIDGIIKSEVGYCGGDSKQTNYKEVCTGNSQGPDFGTQYRSEIFYLNDNQKEIAEKVLNEVNQKLSGRVVTKISLLKNYCVAEEYHQRYLEKR